MSAAERIVPMDGNSDSQAMIGSQRWSWAFVETRL
jgi:hypothetical protein